MRISVIMITHNREELVRKMIEDVVGQTFNDYEFIVIDNCSFDRSGEIADEYAAKYPFVRVIHLEEDISIGAARNVGVFAAEGEYIAFVDDDDRIINDYLETLYNLTENGKYDISACGATEYRNGKEKKFIQIDKSEVLTNKDAVYELLKRRKIRSMSPAKLIRRELFRRYPFREDVVHDDTHVIYKYLADANGVSIDKVPKYQVIRHNDNISSFLDQKKGVTKAFIEEYYMAYMDRKKYLEEKFPDMKEYLVYNVASYMISMCDKISKYCIPDCDGIYRQMVCYLTDKNNYKLISKYASEAETRVWKSILQERD